MDHVNDPPRASVVGFQPDARTPDCRDVTGWPTEKGPPLGLSVSYPVPEVCVVELAGDLDERAVPFFATCVREQLATGPVQLVIELDAVTFLGSAGLAALVECSGWLTAAVPGSTLHLTGAANQMIHRPLEVTGLLPLFQVHTTLSEALAQIATGPEHPDAGSTEAVRSRLEHEDREAWRATSWTQNADVSAFLSPNDWR